MLARSISSWRSPTTRSSTARARSTPVCRGPSRIGSPICDCCMDGCSATPARSCSSWATSSGNRASGSTTRRSPGIDLRSPLPRGLQRWIGDLNRLYRSEPALHATEFERESFAWVDRGDRAPGIISLLRRGTTPDDVVLFVCNFTSDVCRDHVVTVPFSGRWRERLNSDAAVYGGANHGNLGGCQAIPGSDGRAPRGCRDRPRPGC